MFRIVDPIRTEIQSKIDKSVLGGNKKVIDVLPAFAILLECIDGPGTMLRSYVGNVALDMLSQLVFY